MQELMQELKKELKIKINIYQSSGEIHTLGEVDGLGLAWEMAESMLEKEKEVMESAWQDGMYECDGDGTFEDFYKTFNTKEK